MSAKILVADDSLTIQKVVKITLADLDYEIDECLNEDDLFTKASSDDYDLILVDINLSSDVSGQALAKKLREQGFEGQILALLGTFDNVNEQELIDSGYNQKIVKPFESSKFISLCAEMIEESESEYEYVDEADESEELEASESSNDDDDEEYEYVDEEVEELDDSEDDFDEATQEAFVLSEDESENDDDDSDEESDEDDLSAWQVMGPEGVSEESTETSEDADLNKEIEDWGFGDETSLINSPAELSSNEDEFGDMELPPIIDEAPEGLADLEEITLPSDDDLDFPDPISEISSSTQVSSKFISADELAPDDGEDDEFGDEETKPVILQEGINLEEEILNDASPDELWSIDESASSEGEVSVSGAAENHGDFLKENPLLANEAIDKLDELQLEKNLDELKAGPSFTSKDSNINVDDIIKSIMPQIEDIVRAECQKRIEQIAWEVIPDLAENIIKAEIEKISQKYLQE